MSAKPGNVACPNCLHEQMAILTSWLVDSRFGKAAVLEGGWFCEGCGAHVQIALPFAEMKWEAGPPKTGPLEALTRAVWDDT